MSSGSKQSYSYNGWQRLRTLCLAMRQTEGKVQKLKEEIETKLKITQKIRDKRADVQASQVAIQSLETQLEWRKGKVRTLSARLSKSRRNFGERDAKLLHFRQNVEEEQERLIEMQRNYIAKREKVVWTGAQLFMRRKQLVEDVIFIYAIEQQQESSTKPCLCKQIAKISSVHLPDAEDYAGHSEVDLSIGLGYVCHTLQLLSRIFDIPLRYSLNYYGSRSSIVDAIDPNLQSNQSKFPLFCRGQDKNVFKYGVYLLNKNVAQFRCDCGISTQDLRFTLANLRSLMDYLCGAKIEPILFRPSRFNQPQSPVPSGNSIESSTISVNGSDRSLYRGLRIESDTSIDVSRSNLNQRSGSLPLVPDVTLHPTNGLELPKVNGDCPTSSIFESEHTNSNFTTDGWTADECIEHNRKILKTCYFNSDEFVDEDENHKNIYSNGDIFNPATILS